MTNYPEISTILVIILLAFALLLILRRRRDSSSYIAISLIGSFLVWETTILIYRHIPQVVALVSWRIAMALIMFYPVLFVYLISNISTNQLTKNLKRAYAIVIAVVSLITLSSNLVINSTNKSGYFLTGTLYNIYGFIFVLSLAFSITLSVYLYMKEKDKFVKEQLLLLSIGIFIVSSWGALINYVLPMIIEEPPYIPTGIGTLAFIGLVLTSIYKYKFLGIKLKRIPVNAKLALTFIASVIILLFLDFQIRPHLSNEVVIYVQIIYVIFVLIIMSAAMTMVISRPLAWLKSAINKMQQGDLDSKIEITRNDEFGDIAKAFEETRLQLRANKKSLELKVHEKTKRLSEKVSELEKFKDLVVDSEIHAEKMRKERDEALSKLKKQ